MLTNFTVSHLIFTWTELNMSAITNELALFQKAPMEQAVQDVTWIEYLSTTQLSPNGPITFNVNGTSAKYILLNKTRLHVKVRILKTDDTPITKDDNVSLVNLSLHSLFRQVDVSLQQQVITPTVGVNYPYKAMLDVLLNYPHDVKDSQLQCEGYFKDLAGYMDNATVNNGHTQRHALTKDGTADFEGTLHIDVAQQPKAILNGVQLSVKLFQHDDSFRLFSGTGDYKVEIVDAVLKVCHIKVNPHIILAHNNQLKKTPAIYPFWRSDIKTYAISAGNLTYAQDDLFQGLVPNKMIVAFTSSAAYTGDITKNPFNFHHFNLNYLELSVDGRSVPGVPFQPIFTPHTDDGYSSSGYVHEYLSLFKNNYPQKTGNWILRSDFPKGYALFVFDIKPGTSEELFSSVRRGRTRLSVRFGSGLSEPAIAIVYALFPDEFRIDQSRNVVL